jgi:hypothetical protein
MRYGWIGSVALIAVGDTILSKDEYKNFNEMNEKQDQEIKNNKLPLAGVLAAVLIFSPLILSLPITVISVIADKSKKLEKQREQQYNYLIKNFALNGINKFMGYEA